MRFLHKKSFPTCTHSTVIRNPSFGMAYKLTVFFGQDTLNKLKTATLSLKEKNPAPIEFSNCIFFISLFTTWFFKFMFSVMVVGVNHQQNVWFGKVMILAYKFVSLANGMTSALYNAPILFLD